MSKNINIDYLDLLPKKLDDQQKIACCADGNVIVAAGAGSGKTQVLATRFAYLVMSHGIKAEKILTLTFTKKAASEMYQRIYQTLVFFSKHPDVPELEKERALEAVNDFAKVHIQTLDSYNSSILRQCASRYGIRPDFTQGESGDKNQALKYVMKHRNENVIHNLVSTKNSGNLQQIASAIQNEIMTRSSLASDPDHFVQLCEKKRDGCVNLWNKNRQFVMDVMDEFNKLLKIVPSVTPTINNWIADFNKLNSIMQNVPQNVAQMTTMELDSFISSIKSIPFTIPGGKANDVVKSMKELVRLVRYQIPDSGLSNLLVFANYLKSYQDHLEYAAFLDNYMKEVNQEKRISGCLSFNDISEMALKALKEQDDLRLQEQNAFDRIMIDEFQDNNQKNRDLLFLISAKPGLTAEESLQGSNLKNNKLFFVGDDKQSIYKFRGADVSVFKQLGEDLDTEPIDMVYNYRSTEYLLDSFNQIFGGYDNSGKKVPSSETAIFPENVSSDEKYAATFTDRQIAKRNMNVMPVSEKDFINSPVHFCLYNNNFTEDSDVISKKVKPYQKELQKMGKPSDFASGVKMAFISDEDQICYFIAKEISERINNSNGKLSYHDFAILDKSRGMRRTLSKYLSYFDIPYNLDQQIDIFESAPVNDIYNLLRLCVYPSDKKALATFLCSPFAGLSVNDIEQLFSMDFEIENKENFDKCLDSFSEVLSNESFERLKKSVSLFHEIRARATGNLLAGTISELWYDYGYRYETLWHKDLYLSGEQYDLLFELARRCDSKGVSLSYFIDELDALKSAYGDDSEIDIAEIEYPKENSDAVQVMTIHKSKGLQFPYVFVLGVNGNASGDYSEKDEEVTDETPFGEPNSIEHAKADAEFRRVIYVALTRAEKEVYIVGTSWFKNSVMNSVCKNYYPLMEDDPLYSLGLFTYNDGAPFDYISILPIDRNELLENRAKSETKKEPLTLKAKADFITANENLFNDVAIITMESQTEKNPLVKPSKLEKGKDEVGPALSANKPIAPELSSLKPKLMEKNFNAAHFGIFAHAFIEEYVKDSENVLHHIPASVFRNLWDYNLSEKENFENPLCQEMIKVCMKMCQVFDESQFAKDLSEAVNIQTEYAFVAWQNEMVINGIIDLCYKMPDGRVVIVDYKTDEEIHPDKYYPQLSCYKNAASELFGVEKSQIECHLFYLRYGQSVNVTEEADDSLLPLLSES
ncbi:MAG: UvrD-helicase domain-containing protein [Treponema sp.]|nr:UvrD-helicase domain-containing protein [Treponema sp.]